MTDKQLELLLNEIQEGHKREIKSVFLALHDRLVPSSHWLGKTTYKIDMPFSDWHAFEQRFLDKHPIRE